MSITRHGFGKSPYIGPLGRSTFEVMDRILVTAGIFSEHDNMNGTSANIIAGQAVPSGTNAFNLYMNTELLPAPSQSDMQDMSLMTQPEQLEPEDMRSPAVAPMAAPDDFDFGDDFTDKMNASKDISLDDYLQEIGSHPEHVAASDFDFGFGIEQQEEYALPPAQFSDIQLQVVKSNAPTTTRRRRNKK